MPHKLIGQKEKLDYVSVTNSIHSMFYGEGAVNENIETLNVDKRSRKHPI